MNNIPSDLISYLSNTPSLVISMEEGEVRKAELFSLSELKIERFQVESEEYDDEGDPLSAAEFEGCSLLKTTEGYDPDGVLVWLTELKEYGAWDCDHLRLITFPGATWSKIIADPTWYVNGQWYPDRIEHRSITPE
ncbi:hypothetical protein NT6N_24590 [Oceaniferula spumae]|uniref:Uncharacterized protein n=1 Tax=Oceaniferula spumae TaxID=2979115 RepID=A0AAT9FN37_9BACT